jgi:hypothetical protein
MHAVCQFLHPEPFPRIEILFEHHEHHVAEQNEIS